MTSYRSQYDLTKYMDIKSPKEGWILPFTLSELSCKRSSNLHKIANMERTSNVNFDTIPPGSMKDVLKLPYNIGKSKPGSKKTEKVVVKTKATRRRGASTTASTRINKNITQINLTEGVDYALAPVIKRPRFSESSKHDSSTDVFGNHETNIFTGESFNQVKEVVAVAMPLNLDEILNEIFTHFYDIVFDLEYKIKWVYLSVITPQNCTHLGIPDYFEKFPDLEKGITIAYIKEKLESNKYYSYVGFVYDFRTMFENIIAYFPDDSEHTDKAKELGAEFEQKWKDAEARFIYPESNSECQKNTMEI